MQHINHTARTPTTADALIHTHDMTKHPNTPEREYTHLTDTKTMMKHPNTRKRTAFDMSAMRQSTAINDFSVEHNLLPYTPIN